jgi:hypothetical protein
VSFESSSGSGQESGIFTGFNTQSVEDQLTELRTDVSLLDGELTSLRNQYEDVTRHVLNAAMNAATSSELTSDDVSKLIDKMSALMNRTAMQWYQQQTTRQSTSIPKGKPIRL